VGERSSPPPLRIPSRTRPLPVNGSGGGCRITMAIFYFAGRRRRNEIHRRNHNVPHCSAIVKHSCSTSRQPSRSQSMGTIFPSSCVNDSTQRLVGLEQVHLFTFFYTSHHHQHHHHVNMSAEDGYSGPYGSPGRRRHVKAQPPPRHQTGVASARRVRC